MNTPDSHIDIAAYITGELSAEQVRQGEAHLESCTHCAQEVASLDEVQQLLVAMPPEMLLDGPPEDADLLLQRTVRQIRAEASTVRPRRWILAATAAVMVVVVALSVGFLIGRTNTDSTPSAVGPTAPSTATTTPTPGTRYASATDAGTGARLTVQVVPAAGWVRVTAAVTGIPAGQRCRLIVLGRDGSRQLAGSWRVSAAGATAGTTLNGSALVDPADVAGILVENTTGKKFVTAGF